LGIIELIIIAIGLSMDAFAVSVSKGLRMANVTFGKAFIVGLYFGSFQAVMPLIAFLIAFRFAGLIEAIDHWIAFSLLVLIGGKMIFEALKKDKKKGKKDSDKNGDSNSPETESTLRASQTESTLRASQMLPLALATSIDAMAVGVSFAFLQVKIIPAVSLIGIITLILSMIGMKIGSLVGAKFESKAELAGGIILILIGLRIILEHTGILVI